jgi:UPF0755 protein
MTTRPRSRPKRHRVSGSPRGRSTAGAHSRAKQRRPRTQKSLGFRVVGALGLGVLLAALVLGPLLVWARAARGPASGRRVAVEWTSREAWESARQLEALGLTQSPRLMAFYLWFTRSDGQLQPGQHLLSDGLSPEALVARLARRPTRPEARVTFPEGWTHLDMAARLEEREICGRSAFIQNVRDPRLLSELGIPNSSAEGYLFPATYRWRVDSDPREIVRAMVAEFQRRLAKVEQAHPGALEALRTARGWGKHEVVVLASIVEKETARAEERALVASVYHNRLTHPDFEPRGRLQSDPTAAYGCLVGGASLTSCAGYRGHVTPGMVRDAANPYNTYRRPGLPPGPIANPGEASLTAVLVPAATDYLFFVANGNGGHTFSKTYLEHQGAIQGAQ